MADNFARILLSLFRLSRWMVLCLAFAGSSMVWALIITPVWGKWRRKCAQDEALAGTYISLVLGPSDGLSDRKIT
jgi:hypothetical protein